MSDADVAEDSNLAGDRENQLDIDSSLFSSLNLNDITIEDIEEVIKKDNRVAIQPDAQAGPSTSQPRHSSSASSMDGVHRANMKDPYVKILIEPAQKALRFRYECEGRSAGSIPGQNSTPENKTYPTIQVMNFVGPAVVVVSCVTKDQPYRPHPHKLVGKEGCRRGICTVEINNDNMVCSFSNLGIQCVKRKDIEDALKEREEARVDPFGTTFAHKNQTGNIDLNSVRLCFQVFLEGSERRQFTRILPPVVSDPIFDKKAMCDLVICKLSACSASVLGGSEIILLCEKIVRDDIQVRFYEQQKDGQVTWEGLGDFQPSDVHKQVAISLKTPRYEAIDKQPIEKAVDVQIQLRRPSDGSFSDPRLFQFLPADTDQNVLENKRRKIAGVSLDLYLADNVSNRRQNFRPMGETNSPMMPSPRQQRQILKTKIKVEPPDAGYGGGNPTTSHYMVHGAGSMTHQHRNQPSDILAPMQASGGGGSGSYYRPRLHQHHPTQSTLPMETSHHSGSIPPSPFQMTPNRTMSGDSASSSSNPAMMYQFRGPLPPNIHHHQQQQQQHHHHQAMSPEVITVPSYSSAGSSVAIASGGSDPSQHNQHGSGGSGGLGSGSTHLSLGLGSLDSLPLSELSLGLIGSHLHDTFNCLNPDMVTDNLNVSGLMAGLPTDYDTYQQQQHHHHQQGSASAGARMPSGEQQQHHQMQQSQTGPSLSREQSVNSLTGIQNLQDQILELNQLAGVNSLNSGGNSMEMSRAAYYRQHQSDNFK